MSQNQGTNSSISILKWMDIDNVSKQICSGHNWNIFFSFMKSKNCVFHMSFNKAGWYKNMIACKYRQLSTFSHQDIFSIQHDLICLLHDLGARWKA